MQTEIQNLPIPEKPLHLNWTDRPEIEAFRRDFMSRSERWFFAIMAIGVVAPSGLLIGDAVKCVAGIVIDFCGS